MNITEAGLVPSTMLRMNWLGLFIVLFSPQFHWGLFTGGFFHPNLLRSRLAVAGTATRLQRAAIPKILSRTRTFINSRPWRRRGSCGRRFSRPRRGNSSRVVAYSINDSLYTRSTSPFSHSRDMYSRNLLDFPLFCIPLKNLLFLSSNIEIRNNIKIQIFKCSKHHFIRMREIL